MRVCKKYIFDEITGFKLGWSLIGPPLMTTHSYLLGDLMVDTGQSHMQKEALEIAKSFKVKRICLTHHHEDHSGNAAAIKVNLNATVLGDDLTIKKMAARFNIFPYQKIVWGKATPVQVDPLPEKIPTLLGPMIPIHTPGHSKDHMVYFLKDKGILFSGDLYLADRIKYFRADEDINSQIMSLKKVMKLDFDMLLCGHYPRQKNGKHHIQSKLTFLEDFYGAVVRLLQKGLLEKQIFKQLNLEEAQFIRYFCFGNVSMMNGVRSVIRHHESNRQCP